MGFQRGFKTEAATIAGAARAELGLSPMDKLDPFALAEGLAIPVHAISTLSDAHPHIRHLLDVEPDAFSAVTVFDGHKRAIAHNDVHSPERQNSNIAHELAHGLLQHPPTPALDTRGLRDFQQNLEDEAAWLAGCLLVTEDAALAIARGQWTRDQAGQRLGVSRQMIQYRLNVTGAVQRVARARGNRASR